MVRILYVGVANIGGALLSLLVGAILLVAMSFTAIKLSAVIGITILIYVLVFIAGIVCAIIDPLQIDS